MNRPLTFLALLLLPATAFAAGEGAGLDSLGDDALMGELGQRGMTTLLNRAFEVNKIPEDARSGQLALIAISQLNDPSAAKMPYAQKRALVDQAVKGIQGALPNLKDPKALMKATTALINESIKPDVNTLEYWGENPKTQSELRPVVEAVVKMLDRAHDEAAKATEAAANKIPNPQATAAIAKWEELNNLTQTAEYTKYLLNYDLVLSLDKADPKRKTITDATINYLKDLDTSDNPVRATVDITMGKLYMLTGDFDKAAKFFTIVAQPDKKNFDPIPGVPQNPDIPQQYEANYFLVVNQIIAGKPDDAEKQMGALLTWQTANLPKDEGSTKGSSAAAAMLKYRIESLRADLAKTPEDKKKSNDAAMAVLFQLLKDQPQYQRVIFDQLMGKLPQDAPMANLDPLLLRALVSKGQELAVKPDPLTPDGTKTTERAVAAANELTTRKGVNPELLNYAMLIKGFLLQKLNRLPDAANAYLDFATKYAKDPTQKQNADLTISNAEAVVGQIRKDPDGRETSEAIKVYDRLLPISINQFGHNELAYEYAKRLLKQNKPVEAITYFKLVPANDKRLLFAHYYETIALKGQLDTLKTDSPQRGTLLAQIQTLADEVRKGAEASLTTAAEKDKVAYRSMLAGTSLLAAELARADQKQPQRALDLLKDFETQVKGLPDESNRLTDMLLIRVQSYMSLNQTDNATQELVKLLQRSPAEGGGLVYNVLTSLDDQLSKAEGAGDKDQIREIARNRAKLTGFLVKMARDSKDPNINKLSYGYAVFDAEVQRYAAMQETTDAAKKAGLTTALDLFKKLETPEGLAQYKADLDSRKKAGASAPADGGAPGQPEPAPQYDPAVMLGLARTEFDLGEWKDARDRFGRLVNEKKLGPPVRITHENGQDVEVDNDQYWEANFKLLRANFTLADPTDVEKSKRYLKGLYVREGEKVGGKKWHGDFEKLRAEVIPDFDPNNLVPAASQPVAAEVK